MKIGTYKEGNFIVTYYEDGLVISMVFNPMFDGPIEVWNKLPDGYKFPR